MACQDFPFATYNTFRCLSMLYRRMDKSMIIICEMILPWEPREVTPLEIVQDLH
ncbi:MAG: hypothetical protein HWN65_00125 [Candidatus Helarchaeota archaeon]|nr:hypothetical protein [Candidatus Helarchaeota archaeon]